jgi:hypothetical protein
MIGLDPETTILLCTLVWVALLLATLSRYDGRRFGTIGLPIAFLISYMAAYFGALVHLVDGYNHFNDPYLRDMNFTRETVAAGFEASTLAVLSAYVGFLVSDFLKKEHRKVSAPIDLQLLRKRSIYLMAIGLVFLILGAFLRRLNLSFYGLQAFFSAIENLLVVGACGFLLYKYITQGWSKSVVWAASLVLLLPAIRMLTSTILADSVLLGAVIASFFLVLSGSKLRNLGSFWPRLLMIALLVASSYLFAVFYMQSRASWRQIAVEGGSIEQIFGSILGSAQSFDINTSVTNEALYLLDSRLNQNVFVGKAIERLGYWPEDFENGSTLSMAVIAWIPRALWPDKPERGGSRLVSKHTGMQFSESTTFGAGLVFEFYINFGFSAIFFGFVLIGFVFRNLDDAAFEAFRRGDLYIVAKNILIGIPLIQPLAELFYISIAVFAAWLVAGVLRFCWGHQTRMTPRRAN